MADLSLAVITPSNDLTSDGDRKLARELATEIEGEVRFGRHDRMLYSTDASIYQVEPLGVVVPKTLADLRITVEFAARHGLPILPRGGGTSLAGQAVNRALVIDASKHLRRIMEVDPRAMTCRVEPGVVLDQLNGAVAQHGLRFGPDVATSSHATLGGMIGNNSAGAHSLVYGRTVEHLQSLKVIRADGARCELADRSLATDDHVLRLAKDVAAIVAPLRQEIRARFPRTRRRVNGYNFDLILDQIDRSAPGLLDEVNLAHLVCGSEGTLAVIEEATLRLVPMPRQRGLAIIAFSSVDEALAVLLPILDTRPAAVEMLDDVVIAMARGNSEYRRYVDLLPRAASGSTEAVLYVEYFAEDEPQLAAKLESLARQMHPNASARYTEPAAMAQAWKLRKAGEPLLHGVPGARKPITFIEDTAVDPARLAAFVREFRSIVTKHGTTAAYYAHASVGCLHIRPLVDPHDARDHATMVAIAEEVTDLVKKYEGALSGEHGDGRVRSPLLERFYGRAICDGFAQVKRLFDPENRLNPGNIIAAYEPARLLESLRVKPAREIVRVPEVATFFRYDHGFEDAVEQCNGAGVCRKTTGGTMCPSYRATLDERHATRGRGNALRLAITGQLTHPPSQVGETPGRRGGRGASQCAAEWNDAETIATLDLCLSCKACKSECPSNVDVAKLKAEYHGQRLRDARGVPLRTRLIGNVRAINRIGSTFHPLANALSAFPPTAALIRKIIGIDSRRSLPRFGPSLFRWMKKRGCPGSPNREFLAPIPDSESRGTRSKHAGSPNRDEPVVILLPDCFTSFSEPHIGRAAVEALEACGYRVVLPDIGCCGRSMISVGMMEDAQRVIAGTASALIAAVERHSAVAVVGAEPSCISAIKDDWLDLCLPSPPGRGVGSEGERPNNLRALAAKTYLVEEFLDRFWTIHPRRPEFDGQRSEVSDQRSEISGQRSADSGKRTAHSDAPTVNPQSSIVNPAAPGSESRATSILLHTHCHQKALWGSDTSANLLRRVFGEENVRALDTGCCGMAGSFGYAPHRYDLSMTVGRLSLFPAIEDATTEALRHREAAVSEGINSLSHRERAGVRGNVAGREVVVLAAPGTSCRHQIRDGCGIAAVHPVELVAHALRLCDPSEWSRTTTGV